MTFFWYINCNFTQQILNYNNLKIKIKCQKEATTHLLY